MVVLLLRHAELRAHPQLEQALQVDEARHPERPRRRHRLDALRVHLVTVVDNIDTDLDALEDHVFRRYVRPHARAAVVRGRNDRRDLVAGHVATAPPRDAVTGAGEDLDNLDSAADLLANE